MSNHEVKKEVLEYIYGSVQEQYQSCPVHFELDRNRVKVLLDSAFSTAQNFRKNGFNLPFMKHLKRMKEVFEPDFRVETFGWNGKGNAPFPVFEVGFSEDAVGLILSYGASEPITGFVAFDLDKCLSLEGQRFYQYLMIVADEFYVGSYTGESTVYSARFPGKEDQVFKIFFCMALEYIVNLCQKTPKLIDPLFNTKPAGLKVSGVTSKFIQNQGPNLTSNPVRYEGKGKSEPTGREICTHARRGHWKNVRCGPGRANLRQVWINHCIVNEHKGPVSPSVRLVLG